MIDTNALIGIPFVFGGRDPATGLDCWGLVAHVLREQGLPMPFENPEPATLAAGHRLMTEQARSGSWACADGSVGDVAALYRIDWVVHVGVVVSPGLVLHTSKDTGVLLQTPRAVLRHPSFTRMAYYRWAGMT